MRLRVLSLVPAIYDTSPGQRFRLEQWSPSLQHEGIEIEHHPFEDDELHAVLYQRGRQRDKVRLVMRAFRRRFALLKRLSDYDAVYVFREAAIVGPPIIERVIRRGRVPMVFDFDDAVFIPYKSPTNSYLSMLKFPGKTREICRIASLVMAGNEYLADYARKVNENTSIVPTTIDTTLYTPRPAIQTTTLPVIGWSGSHSTVQHLDTLKNVLNTLSKQEQFKLRVIGTPNYSLDRVLVESIPWRSATEIHDLNGIDIGIMPLPDDKWSKGKCGLKALQYMALGLPTVCSPVGVNSAIIQHEVNGMIAGNDEEWIAALSRLLNDPGLCARLGAEARGTVEERYSSAVVAPKVAALFHSVSAASKAPRSSTHRDRVPT